MHTSAIVNYMVLRWTMYVSLKPHHPPRRYTENNMIIKIIIMEHCNPYHKYTQNERHYNNTTRRKTLFCLAPLVDTSHNFKMNISAYVVHSQVLGDHMCMQ